MQPGSYFYFRYLVSFSVLFFLGFGTMKAQEDTTSVFEGEEDDAFYDMSLEELMSMEVVTASKKSQDINEAPSIISAVSKKDIEKMGVTSLVDVLQFIPSVEVSMGVNGHYRVAIRGVRKDGNILVLVNGHHINNFYDGRSIYDFPITFIERVEVIRGPGSALFGTNAVAGVINIITVKNNKSATVMAGDNNTYSAAINYGWGEDSTSFVSVSAGFLTTDGANVEPRSDTIQTDEWTNNDVPLGELKTNRHLQDIYLNTIARKDNLEFSLFGIMRKQGSWVGPLFELSPESVYKNNQFIADLSYDLEVSDKLSVTPKIYADVVLHDYLIQERPAGYTIGSVVYKDGAFTKEKYSSLNMGGEVQANYSVNDDLNFITGVVYENMSMLDFMIERNHKIVGNEYFGDVDGFNSYNGYKGFANHDSVEINELGKSRQIFAGYLQGDYVHKYFNVTVGGRFDSYSDFGSSINPRLGLILKPHELFQHKLTKGLYLKALYGQAFRAPTFNELYFNSALNNDGYSGNTDLSPETVKSLEGSVTYKRSAYFLQFNMFSNQNDNIIGIYDPNGSGGIGVYQNLGLIQSSGFGFEGSVRIAKKFNINLNYTSFNMIFNWNPATVSKAEIDFINANVNRKNIVNTPQTRINLMMDYTTKKFQVFTGFVYGAEAVSNQRSAIEKLSPAQIPPYLMFNYSLAYNVNENLRIQVSGKNIGLKAPAIGGIYFTETSGAIKYSDPDPSTNIELLGFNGMGQVGNTNRISIKYTF